MRLAVGGLRLGLKTLAAFFLPCGGKFWRAVVGVCGLAAWRFWLWAGGVLGGLGRRMLAACGRRARRPRLAVGGLGLRRLAFAALRRAGGVWAGGVWRRVARFVAGGGVACRRAAKFKTQSRVCGRNGFAMIGWAFLRLAALPGSTKNPALCAQIRSPTATNQPQK